MKCCSCLTKISAYKTLSIINWIIFIFAIVLAAVVILSLNNYDGDSSFTASFYTSMLVLAVMAFGLVYLGCRGANSPREKPNYLFCHWIIVSFLLISNIASFFFFVTFITSRSIEVENNDRPVLTVFKKTYAKVYNDYVLSSYVACCTGCSEDFNGLTCAFDISDDFPPKCNISLSGDELNNNQKSKDICLLPEICSAADLEQERDSFISFDCFQTLDKVPSSDVGVNSCAFFEYLGIVGEPSDGKCGSGVPQIYVDDFVNYFNDRFYRLSIPWMLFIFFLFCAWTASLFLIVCHSSGRDYPEKR